MEELLGCWQEAKRADKTAELLVRIRAILDLEFYDHITAVLREVETSSRLLRDLYDLFPIYKSRVPMIMYYLNIVLPSMMRTMRDMMVYIDNDALPAKTAWTLMSERLGEQGGLTLAARFVMYVEALIQMVRLLSRSPLYDPTSLELLRMRHLRLRILQGIPAPPVPAQHHHAPAKPTMEDLERRHWAEKIFEDSPKPSIGLRHRRDSKCFGPPMVDVRLGITPGAKVLFKLSPFDKNKLSVTLYLQPDGPDLTRLLCRWVDRYYNPLYSCYGVHELCVRRKGSALQFRRWSVNRAHPTLWMALFFKTWEKMVLFHCAFAALKSRCPLTINVTPDDLILAGEKKLFQGKILDDGFEHILTVLQDVKCGGVRLQASVGRGELKKCPVWTAFATFQFISTDWLDRRSRRRIWVKDLKPFVFCKDYKKRHQIKKGGQFEIHFVTEEAADDFQDLFHEGTEIGQIVEVNALPGGDSSG